MQDSIKLAALCAAFSFSNKSRKHGEDASVCLLVGVGTSKPENPGQNVLKRLLSIPVS